MGIRAPMMVTVNVSYKRGGGRRDGTFSESLNGMVLDGIGETSSY